METKTIYDRFENETLLNFTPGLEIVVSQDQNGQSGFQFGQSEIVILPT